MSYWIAYIDESGTHKESPILVMGMALAAADRWEAFEREWNAMLEREQLPYIHFTELVNRRRPRFGKYNSTQASKLLDECNSIIAAHIQMSSISILKKVDFNRFYKDQQWERSPIPRDSALGILFRATASFLPHWLREAGIDADAKINLVYEAGVKNQGDLVRLFATFKKLAPPDWQERMGTLSFATKGQARGLEAADSVSFGALQTERAYHSPDDDVGIENTHLVVAEGDPKPAGAPAFRLAVGEESLRAIYDDARAAIKDRRTRAEESRVKRGI